MKQNRIRKCLRAAALAVVALILVLAGTVFALWHNEFAHTGLVPQAVRPGHCPP